MNASETLLAVGGGLALPIAAACLLLVIRTRRELAAARAESADLRAAVDRLTAAGAPADAAAPRAAPAEDYVITQMPAPVAEPAPAPALEGRLFADLVLRESVVRVAALAHGVRRALAPETRNRIRFEIGREVKRVRKQRRADVRTAVREWEARQRGRQSAAESGEDAA